MSALHAKLESLLFASTRPLTVKKLADLVKEKPAAVEAALAELVVEYAKRPGVRLVRSGNEYQMTTAPEQSKLVADFLKEELTGELTRPQLETLTIICYRAPVSKAEIEMIRGINCSLILRNLAMRGLVEAEEDAKLLTTRYRPTVDLLKYLGIASVGELPDYDRLHNAAPINDLLKKKDV